MFFSESQYGTLAGGADRLHREHVPRPGAVHQADEVCTIEDWRWYYDANPYANGGGYIEVDGVVANYPVGPLNLPEIHVRFYDVTGSGATERETYLGKDMDFIRADAFDVSIESRCPAGSLRIKWTCLP